MLESSASSIWKEEAEEISTRPGDTAGTKTKKATHKAELKRRARADKKRKQQQLLQLRMLKAELGSGDDGGDFAAENERLRARVTKLEGQTEGAAGVGLEGGDGDLAGEVGRLRAQVAELKTENLTHRAMVRFKAENSAMQSRSCLIS